MAPSKQSRRIYYSKPSKSRTENWVSEEKLYLIELCAERLNVIEDKRTDSLSVALKCRAWDEIHQEFDRRFSDTHREKKRMKEQWKRLKVFVRVEVQKQLRQKQEQLEACVNKMQQTSNDVVRSLSNVDNPTTLANNIKGELDNDNDDADEVTANDISDSELNPVVEKMLSVLPSLALNTSMADDSCGVQSMHHAPVICDIDIYSIDSNEGSATNGDVTQLEVTSPEEVTTCDPHAVIESVDSRGHSSARIRRRSTVCGTSDLTARPIHRPGSPVKNGTTVTNNLDHKLQRHERKLVMMEEEHCAKMEVIAIRKQVALLEKRLALRRLASMNS